MAIQRLDFLGTPNLGVFSFANDNFVLVRRGLPKRIPKVVEETLKVSLIEANIGQSSLIGVLSAGNSNGIILPYYAMESEMLHIKKNTDLNIGIIPSKLTCFGNIVLCNDYGAILHPKLEPQAVKSIEETLDVEGQKGRIGLSPLVGSLAVATNRGVLAAPHASEEELQQIREILKVPVNIGTTNRGVFYVRAGLLANSHGAIAGFETTGPELVRIGEALDIE
ncbi:MAG: translation initiation factor IF-6 [Promethearchaeota archaeon]